MASVDVDISGRWRRGWLVKPLVYPLLWVGCRLPFSAMPVAHALAYVANAILRLSRLEWRIEGRKWEPIGARPALVFDGTRYHLDTVMEDR